jgi:hypothetical protein
MRSPRKLRETLPRVVEAQEIAGVFELEREAEEIRVAARALGESVLKIRATSLVGVLGQARILWRRVPFEYEDELGTLAAGIEALVAGDHTRTTPLVDDSKTDAIGFGELDERP